MSLLKKIAIRAIVAAALLLITVTAGSLLYNSGLWYFRALNFPRVQTLLCLAICLIAYLFTKPKKGAAFYTFTLCLIAAIVVQGYILYPYTALAKKEIAPADSNRLNPQSVFSIVAANVLMYNRQSDALLSIIRQKDPTFVLTMEVNRWWVDAVSDLNKRYPYRILYPTANTYGMCLYSKLPLGKQQIYFLNHDSVPSFHAVITLPNGASFQLFTIHPVAPKPSEHPDNIGEKEVALPKAARIIAATGLPALAAGDFNDVGWSHNLKVFEQISGLKDLRYGRGFYSTFSATSAIMRWPLDYFFASAQFKVVNIERLPAFGSDHFPYYAQLSLEK